MLTDGGQAVISIFLSVHNSEMALKINAIWIAKPTKSIPIPVVLHSATWSIICKAPSMLPLKILFICLLWHMAWSWYIVNREMNVNENKADALLIRISMWTKALPYLRASYMIPCDATYKISASTLIIFFLFFWIDTNLNVNHFPNNYLGCQRE